MSAKVVSLQLHECHGEHPRAVSEVSARVGGGIEGDSHVDRVRRAVVVLDRSTLDALGLAFGDLREQITIDGLPDVTTLAPGTELRIGGVTLRVTGECEPCTHIGEMNDQPDVLAFQASLVGRRGATCTVIAADGPIRIGDPVNVLVRA
jgi:MOSC domain-containing protein YiiM